MLLFFAAVPVTFALSLSGLHYCLLTTRDYRKRRRFSEATAHLSLSELEAGLSNNLIILSRFLRAAKKSMAEARKAEAALVMATVLKEHIARKQQDYPLPRYLRARRSTWKQAKWMAN